jgi:hypothetical protein
MSRFRNWLLRKLKITTVYVVTTVDDDDKIRTFVTNSDIAATNQFVYWRTTYGSTMTTMETKKLEYYHPL